MPKIQRSSAILNQIFMISIKHRADFLRGTLPFLCGSAGSSSLHVVGKTKQQIGQVRFIDSMQNVNEQKSQRRNGFNYGDWYFSNHAIFRVLNSDTNNVNNVRWANCDVTQEISGVIVRHVKDRKEGKFQNYHTDKFQFDIVDLDKICHLHRDGIEC